MSASTVLGAARRLAPRCDDGAVEVQQARSSAAHTVASSWLASLPGSDFISDLATYVPEAAVTKVAVGGHLLLHAETKSARNGACFCRCPHHIPPDASPFWAASEAGQGA